VSQFVSLIPDLIQVLVGFLLKAIEEAFFLKFVHAFLEQLARSFVAVLAKTKFRLCLGNQFSVRKDFFSA